MTSGAESGAPVVDEGARPPHLRIAPAVVASAIRSGTVVAALLVIYSVLPLRGRWWWLGAGLGFVALLATVPLAVRRLRRVLRAEHPILAAIEAVLVLGTILATSFAAIYYALDARQGQFVGLETRIDSMYFTITTLSTVGFGDISASGQAARVLVTVQILFNLAFFGIALRAFSVVVQHRTGGVVPAALQAGSPTTAERPDASEP